MRPSAVSWVELIKVSFTRKALGYILCTLLGIYILSPWLNFQTDISIGDRGRDYYCFRQTMDGKIPFKDYSWDYKPFRLFYHAFFAIFFLSGIKLNMALAAFSVFMVYGALFHLFKKDNVCGSNSRSFG